MFSLSKRRRTWTKDEDDEDLCSTCSALDLRAILKDSIPQEHAVPLGHLTDILNKQDQYGLCRLIATLIRRLWQLDNNPNVDHLHNLPMTLEIRLLEEDASKLERMKEFHGRRVASRKVWWKGADEVLPDTVRVVDVARMAIVPAPPACRYVALSYVWGSPGDGY
ncbi:hypothetical protein AZE42_01332 [Rhizopogon vesiculosus]|uniref:Heterokaryon incompatibility domain-containing protein n=1 Tax=Rhizopogon vesiculosus TaxID=180088 RepID=A0A1J8PX94_9AGAM|nr:hypothetical protein AZE42_01332 [Rhizopogon vesiculosus]